MLLRQYFLYPLLLSQLFVMNLYAGDFDWLENLSIEAKADSSGFKTRLATRFDLGDVKVKAVLSNVDNKADAYMLMRLGEMSGKDTDHVIRQYKKDKKRGWGTIAQNLGIKPGSAEFQKLKQGRYYREDRRFRYMNDDLDRSGGHDHRGDRRFDRNHDMDDDDDRDYRKEKYKKRKHKKSKKYKKEKKYGKYKHHKHSKGKGKGKRKDHDEDEDEEKYYDYDD